MNYSVLACDAEAVSETNSPIFYLGWPHDYLEPLGLKSMHGFGTQSPQLAFEIM